MNKFQRNIYRTVDEYVETGLDSIQGAGPSANYETQDCAVVMSGTLITLYIDRAGLIIQLGDKLYTTNATNSPVSNGWYVVDDNGVNTRVRVGVSTGEIIQILGC